VAMNPSMHPPREVLLCQENWGVGGGDQPTAGSARYHSDPQSHGGMRPNCPLQSDIGRLFPVPEVYGHRFSGE
jgi:hypothetical protein